jgi:predicted kinase
MTSLIYPELPENGLVVLIGASGAGKSTLAGTWPATQVLSLGALHGAVSDDFSVKFNVLSESAPRRHF